MALIHRAQLSPTKRELIAAWLPSRPWSGTVGQGKNELVGANRFDDPAGVVGIETHLVRAGEPRAHATGVRRRAARPS